MCCDGAFTATLKARTWPDVCQAQIEIFFISYQGFIEVAGAGSAEKRQKTDTSGQEIAALGVIFAGSSPACAGEEWIS